MECLQQPHYFQALPGAQIVEKNIFSSVAIMSKPNLSVCFPYTIPIFLLFNNLETQFNYAYSATWEYSEMCYQIHSKWFFTR